jgi:hypothetical protein
MITRDARRSLSRGNNPVPSPWQATVTALICRPRRAAQIWAICPAVIGTARLIFQCRSVAVPQAEPVLAWAFAAARSPSEAGQPRPGDCGYAAASLVPWLSGEVSQSCN